MSKVSKAGSILKKIREEEEQEIEKKPVEEMSAHELVEYLKENDWSKDADSMKDAAKVIERMCEQADDEEVKLMMEELDAASSEFDLEKVKEKRSKKK
jgi:hypothetical protein